MSYEIIYNKQFVRLRRTGEVIPMLLAGSSNCFEIGRNGRNGRRSRDWSNMRFYNRKGKISEKPDTILANLDAELRRIIRDHSKRKDEFSAKPAQIHERFGYYASLAVGGGSCGETSWDLYRSQFSNGIKNALTVEELYQLGISLYFYDVSIREYENGTPASVPITTEQDYFAELKKWRAWQEQTGQSFWISFYPRADTVLERLRDSRRKPPREKTQVEQDHYFVLMNDKGSLRKYTSRGYQYAWSRDGGKRFMTEQAAEQYRQQLLKKGRYMADTWKVERIDRTAAFRV